MASESHPRAPLEPGSYARFQDAEARRRRRSRIAAALVLAVFAGALLFPPQPPWAEEAARRFGLTGPTQMVTEIQLRPPEESQTARAGRAPAIEALEIPRHRARTRAPAATPEGPAPGEPELPRLVTQDDPGAGLRRADVPVVRSEDLVILTLVRPVYPHEARVQGLEAIVEVEALVDEQGRVRSIEVVSNTGHDMFAQASRDAVRGCQFQPYLRDGEPSPVRARFRFKFKLI